MLHDGRLQTSYSMFSEVSLGLFSIWCHDLTYSACSLLDRQVFIALQLQWKPSHFNPHLYIMFSLWNVQLPSVFFFFFPPHFIYECLLFTHWYAVCWWCFEQELFSDSSIHTVLSPAISNNVFSSLFFILEAAGIMCTPHR